MRILLLGVAAVTILSSQSFAASPLNVRWVLVHEPSEVVERAARDFAAQVEQETKGGLHVEVLVRSEYRSKYNGGKPVTELSAMRDVDSGKIEMCQVFTAALGSYEPGLWAFGMPYLFRDDDHAEKVIEGAIGKRLMNGVQASSNMRALAITYSGGPKIIATKGVEARRPEEIAGLRLMFGSSPVSQSIADQLGIEPFRAPSEAFVSLAKEDLTDGIETTPARFNDLEQYRGANVMINTGHALLTTMIVMNKDFYGRLPNQYQKTIQNAAIEAGRAERRRSLEANLAALQTLPEQGVKIVELSPEEKKGWEKKLQPVYDAVRSLIPSDLISAIRQTRSGTVTVRR
jgi:TRAP-type transport system periplasmic protein